MKTSIKLVTKLKQSKSKVKHLISKEKTTSSTTFSHCNLQTKLNKTNLT